MNQQQGQTGKPASSDPASTLPSASPVEVEKDQMQNSELARQANTPPLSSSPVDAEGLEQEIAKVLEGITPGDWEAHRGGVEDGHWQGPHVTANDQKTFRYVADCRGWKDNSDAEFIAAAPRLLRATLSVLQQKNAEGSLGNSAGGNASTQSTPSEGDGNVLER